MIELLLAAAISLRPCEAEDVKARCGTFSVPENATRRDSRFLDLNVVVVPAPKKHRDAVFVLAGGHGQGATTMTDWIVRTIGAGERDLVLVDARGTGRSSPLHCDSDGKDLFADLWDPASVAACRAKLESDADLTQYTTLHVIRDLEALRGVLGYQKVTLATLRRGLFGEALRNFLYSPEAYVKLPFVVHEAARGNWKPYGDMATRYARNIRSLDLGFFSPSPAPRTCRGSTSAPFAPALEAPSSAPTVSISSSARANCGRAPGPMRRWRSPCARRSPR